MLAGPETVYKAVGTLPIHSRPKRGSATVPVRCHLWHTEILHSTDPFREALRVVLGIVRARGQARERPGDRFHLSPQRTLELDVI